MIVGLFVWGIIVVFVDMFDVKVIGMVKFGVCMLMLVGGGMFDYGLIGLV